MPVPQYSYGDSNPGVTAQGPPPQPRPPEDTWAPPAVYGVQPRYAWPAASVHRNPFVSESHPPWTGSGAPSHPPAWDSKVQLMLLQRVPMLGPGCGQTSEMIRLSSKPALEQESNDSPRRFGPPAAALARAAAAVAGGFGDGGCSDLGTAQKCAPCKRSIFSGVSKWDRAEIYLASPLFVGNERSVAHAVSSRHVPLARDLLCNGQGLERGSRVPLWDFSQKPARLAAHGVPARGDVVCYDITVCDSPENAAQIPGNVMPNPVCPVLPGTHTSKQSRCHLSPSSLSPACLPLECRMRD